MIERRAHHRIRLDQAARVSVDEHCSLPCIVFDRSADGARIVLPEVAQLPDPFVLTIDGTEEILVCRIIWRRADEVGVTAHPPEPLRPVRASLRRQPIGA